MNKKQIILNNVIYKDNDYTFIVKQKHKSLECYIYNNILYIDKNVYSFTRYRNKSKPSIWGSFRELIDQYESVLDNDPQGAKLTYTLNDVILRSGFVKICKIKKEVKDIVFYVYKDFIFLEYTNGNERFLSKIKDFSIVYTIKIPDDAYHKVMIG